MQSRTEPDELLLIERFSEQLIAINHNLQADLKKADCNLHIFPKDIPEELSQNSYYLTNPTGDSWVLYYVNETGELEKKEVSEFKLGVLVENKSIEDILDNSEKIKELIASKERAQAVRNWEKSSANFMTEVSKVRPNDNLNVTRRVGNILAKVCADMDELVVHIETGEATNSDASKSDIAAVIDKRFQAHDKHNRSMLVLHDDFLSYLDQTDVTYSLGCKKLSMLHHWSVGHMIDDKIETEAIVDLVAHTAQKMPHLERLVLRGCGSAANYGFKPLTEPRKCNILSYRANIEEVSIKENEFIFQQRTEINKIDGTTVIRTMLKFYDVDRQLVTKELANIPLNRGGNKLSAEVEKELALASEKYNLPPLSLATLKKTVDESLQSWSRNEEIAEKQKQFIGATRPRTRTYTVNTFPIGSFADQVEQKLKESSINVEIKAYAAPYTTSKAGFMAETSHGHAHKMKALLKQMQEPDQDNSNLSNKYS